jgi:hypothetical protein
MPSTVHVWEVFKIATSVAVAGITYVYLSSKEVK